MIKRLCLGIPAFCLFAATAFLPVTSFGSIVTINFQGKVTWIYNAVGYPPVSIVGLNDPVTASLSYDTTTPDYFLYEADPMRGSFVGPGRIKVNINGFIFEKTNSVQVDILNGAIGGQEYFSGSGFDRPFSAWPAELSTQGFPSIQMIFWQTTQPRDFLADAELPTTLDFTKADYQLNSVRADGYEIGFSLTNVSISVISAPTISCAAPLTLECTNGSAIGTVSTVLQDSSSNAVKVVWKVDGIAYQTNDISPGGAVTPLNLTFTADFQSGEHLVAVSASNGQTPPASCSTTVTVGDSTAPHFLSLSATPNLLWPPNHRMVPVNLNATTTDNCDLFSVSRITKVTSNQPQDPFAPDWEITGTMSVNLRAERSNGAERVYTVFVEAADATGNKTTNTVSIKVPKSQSGQHQNVKPHLRSAPPATIVHRQR